jgi:GT2 family glycosyltransferase
MVNNISTLVGLRNNLEYSQQFYQRFRQIYPNEELIFVSYGSNDGTHQWLDTIIDSNLIYYYEDCDKTFSDTYNKATQLATKDYVIFCHNDIVVCNNFLENLLKHCDEFTAVGYVTIEPPIFLGERVGKIVKDFGSNFNNVNYECLNQFVQNEQDKNLNKICDNSFFFMAISRKIVLNMNGFDNLFSPMFCEDDDFIHRLRLQNINIVTSLDSIVYHFVSKTSRYSDEYESKTNQIETNSNKNLLRKWHNMFYQPRYDIGLAMNDCDIGDIEALEPYFDSLYVNCDYDEYVTNMQPFTKYDLSKKFNKFDTIPTNDVVATVLKKDINYILILQHLTGLLQHNLYIGEVSLGGILIKINRIIDYSTLMIDNNSEYNLTKCLK